MAQTSYNGELPLHFGVRPRSTSEKLPKSSQSPNFFFNVDEVAETNLTSKILIQNYINKIFSHKSS